MKKQDSDTKFHRSINDVQQDQCGRLRAKQQKQLWRDSGLIGCIKAAPADLSVRYKLYLYRD